MKSQISFRQMSIHLPMISYWQYLQLPTSYSFIHHKEMRMLQTDNVFPLFQLNHDASVNIFLDEREILEIMLGKKSVYDFEVRGSVIDESSFTAVLTRPRYSEYNPYKAKFIQYLFTSEVVTEVTSFGVASAQVVSIFNSNNDVQRLGVLGNVYSSKTIIYELLDKKDIEIYGRYVQALVNSDYPEYLGRITSIRLTKYNTGNVVAEPNNFTH